MQIKISKLQASNDDLQKQNEVVTMHVAILIVLLILHDTGDDH